MTYLRSIALFVAAGVAEIGGGYLVWLWLRNGHAAVLGALGGGVLFLYGVLPTLQPLPTFNRIYAAYGGWFVVLALMWGWLIDRNAPDRFDVIGAVIVLAGVAVIAYSPRP